MRVRISYSVDLEDVPKECARMLEESITQINEVHKDIESLIDKLDNTDGIDWQIKDKTVVSKLFDKQDAFKSL